MAEPNQRETSTAASNGGAQRGQGQAPRMDPEVARALEIGKSRRWRRWVKRGIWIAIVVAVGYGIVSLVRGRGAGPVEYVTGEVNKGDLTITVTATGTLEPHNVVDIGPEISGTVRKIYVDFNDRVTAGQVLAELDTQTYEAQVAQAEARLAVARASVVERKASRTDADRTEKRSQELLSRGVISEAEKDTAETAAARMRAAVSLAQAEMRAAGAALDQANTNLRRCVVKSPIDGMVLARMVEVGQTVVASLQAPVIFRLAESLEKMQVFVAIDEADVGLVKENQQATFSVAAYFDRDFEAVVSEVRNAPTSAGNVVTYTAVLDVDNRDLSLKPGMTATVQIVTESFADQLLVPSAALRFDPGRKPGRAMKSSSAQSEERVWILGQDGIPTAVKVQTGPSNGELTILRSSSLKPGDRVLINTK